jgi:hypothetical protein
MNVEIGTVAAQFPFSNIFPPNFRYSIFAVCSLRLRNYFIHIIVM